MGKETVPTNLSELKRLQSAMQREMKKYEPIMRQIESEMTRLSKQSWSKPLLEATKKYQGESSVEG